MVGTVTVEISDETEGVPLSWCAAIGVPSYKAWRDLRKTKDKKADWETTFQDNEERYPWSSKRDQAVWRGSTTYNKALFGHLPFHEIPRARLVEESRRHRHLIDAGFHKIVGKYENSRWINGTMMADAIPLRDMMRYKGEERHDFHTATEFDHSIHLNQRHFTFSNLFKAIIDIDGNNWSARFNELLCMNSVVIKIQPNFIEQFYKDLRPMVHYVPASLENLTETVRRVLDGNNEMKMKKIVSAANEWCRNSITRNALADEAMSALELYAEALDAYDGSWRDEWFDENMFEGVHDLVVCNV